jgi:hypothetical protein
MRPRALHLVHQRALFPPYTFGRRESRLPQDASGTLPMGLRHRLHVNGDAQVAATAGAVEDLDAVCDEVDDHVLRDAGGGVELGLAGAVEFQGAVGDLDDGDDLLCRGPTVIGSSPASDRSLRTSRPSSSSIGAPSARMPRAIIASYWSTDRGETRPLKIRSSMSCVATPPV